MRGISVILFIGCGLWISACASLAPEQPRMLMREIAEACAEQFPDMEVKDVTSFGRLIFEYGEVGQSHRKTFVACYQARVNQEIQALVAPGHLSSSTGVGAHTTVQITLLGDTVLVPVTLNHTSQVYLMVDPGASNTILSPAVLARLGVSVPPDARRWTVTLQGRHPISMPLVRMSSLALGALAVEELDVGISDAFPHVPDVDGVLGADVLDYFRLTVDRASRQLTLEVIHPTTPPKEYPVQDVVDTSSMSHEETLAAFESLRSGWGESSLMAYGPRLPDLWRRAAALVDKIFKGAKLADCPVEPPMKAEVKSPECC